MNDRKSTWIIEGLGIIPVIWLALVLAPYSNEGIIQVLPQIGSAMSDPFDVSWGENSLKTILLLLIIYGMAIGMYESSRKNYRRGEEHGSAKFGSPGMLNKKYRQRPTDENKILTQNVAIGLDGKRHRRNLNVLVCGGSGAGKTRFYCKPNIMQASSSFIVLDPKG